MKPYVDEEIDRDWRRFVTPGRVIVRFRDGQTLEARVDYPKGHPRNPIAEAELAAKTADCATFAATPLPADTATRLVSTTRQLESLADVSELVSVVTGGV